MRKEEAWLRETYADCLIEAAQKDDSIVTVDADLMKAASITRFAQAFPDRAVNAGVQEANMIGVAAGLAAMGKKPFTHTFTAFASRRVCDQVTLSVAYARLPVKMMGSDPGVTAELNGGTHMSFEDVAIMRNIPGMTICEPVDSVQMRALFPQFVALESPLYIRLLRRNADAVYQPGDSFTLGKGVKLREGADVTVVASGIMVAQAVQAAELLQKEGISAEVIDIHTIKPLDVQLILDSAAKTGAVVTAENHSIIGGLGSAVAEALAENHPVPMQRVGVRDHFGEVGFTPYLMEKYGLLDVDVAAAAKAVLARK